MDQKPKIPTLKDTQKPQVRIKGLAARLSLVERLKQFKKKDLAFILAGLGVLFMAPLAEHFMMSPENADTGAFKPGWGFQAKGFGDGTSPYDPGVNGMAPGSQLGGGGDVITPLNVRDPSALVMGPGSSQQPAATSTTPPPPAKENTDWKDAIANAGAKAASAATKAASLPVPKTSLTNAGLRGLGVAGGSAGATWNAPPISASNVPNRTGGGSNMAGVNKAPGYMGVGSRGPKNADAGSLEDLKKMAEKAGSMANRLGSAGTNLETAAGMGKGEGAGMGGDGAGRGGKDDKGPGGNSGKDSKSLGESLAFLAAKAHQQHAIDLYWKLKEKDAMLWPNLKEKLLEEAVMTPFKGLTAGISDAIKGFGSDVAGSYYWDCSASGGPAYVPSSVQACDGKTPGLCCTRTGASNASCMTFVPGGSNPTYSCVKKSGDKSPGGGNTQQGITSQAGMDYGSAGSTSLDAACDAGWFKLNAAAMGAAKNLSSVNQTLGGTGGSKCGGESLMGIEAKNIPDMTAAAKAQMDLVKGFMTASAKAIEAAGPKAREALGTKTIDEVKKLLDEAAKQETDETKTKTNCDTAKGYAKPGATGDLDYAKYQMKAEVETAWKEIQKTTDPMQKAKTALAAINSGLAKVDTALKEAGPGIDGLPATVQGQTLDKLKAQKITEDLTAIRAKQLTAAAGARKAYDEVQTGYNNAVKMIGEPGVEPSGTLITLMKDTKYVVSDADRGTASQSLKGFKDLMDKVEKMDFSKSNIPTAKADYETADGELKAGLQALTDAHKPVSSSIDNMYTAGGKQETPAATDKK